MDIKKLIKEANDFADSAISNTSDDLKTIGDTFTQWANSGSYNLNNKHLLALGLAIVLLFIVF